MRRLSMTAAAQLARDGVQVHAVHPGFTDAAMLRSADHHGQLSGIEGFVVPGAETPAEIADHTAFSGRPQPRKSHAGRRGTSTSCVNIAALYTKAVA